jgi:hypothetical protein
MTSILLALFISDWLKDYVAELFSSDNLPTLILVLVGIGGIIVAIRTLNHMRESSERQLQAYVLPESASLYDGTTLTPPISAKTDIPFAPMIIKNFGQTPAYRVISYSRIAVIPIGDENTMLVVPPLVEQYSNTLGSGASFNKPTWFDRTLTASEKDDIAKGERAIYLYGKIQYQDAFGKARFANFRLQYMGQFPPVPNVILHFSEKGNDAN